MTGRPANKIFFFFILLIALSIGQSQNIDFSFNRLFIEDGLSQNTIYDIIQDRDGYIWISTQDGLNRFDGNEFRVFLPKRNDSTSISGDQINEMCLDKNGNLWIATVNGINRYEKNKGYFYRINGLEDNYVPHHIACDDSGYIWSGSKDKGLCRINNTNGKPSFTYYNLKNLRLPTNLITKIFVDSKKTLWIGSNKGLLKYDSQNDKFNLVKFSRKEFHFPFISEISEDRLGRLLITLNSNKVIRYDPLRDYEEVFWIETGDSKADELIDLRTITEYGDNYWLIGDFGSGIIIYDIAEKKIKKILSNSYQDPNSLSNNLVMSAYVDQSQILWIGTVKGLNKVDLKPQKFNLFRVVENNFNKSSYPFSDDVNFILSLVKINDNKLVATTYGFGPILIDLENRKAAVLPFWENEFGTVHWACYQDKDDVIWLGGNFTVTSYDVKTGKLKKWTEDGRTYSILDRSPVRDIVEDKDGKIWFCRSGKGLYVINADRSKMEKYAYNPDLPGAYIIIDLYIDDEDILWISTDKGGVYQVNINTGECSEVCYSDGKEVLFRNLRVNRIHKDSWKRVWLATNDGLYVKDMDKPFVKRVDLEPELKSDYIYSIEEDKLHNLWLGTNGGLIKIARNDSAATILKSYDARDGLQSNEFNTNCSFIDEEGVLYFGGVNGVNFFDPAKIKDNPYIPPIVISSVKINDQIMYLPLEADELRLYYYQNRIQFNFAALDFTNPNKNNYMYKLEGFDNDWIYANNERQAVYTNLEAGDYAFLVRGSNNDRVWNRDGAVINICIEAPFWKTKIAYAFYTLCVIFLIYLYIRLRSINLMRLNRKLEFKVQEKTKELTNSYEKLRDSQMQLVETAKIRAIGTMANGIAHDFNNLLTIILGSVELLKLKVQGDISKKHVENIESAAHDGAEIIKKIQDFSRVDKKQTEIQIQSIDLAKLMDELIAIIRHNWVNQKRMESIEVEFRKEYSPIKPVRANPSEIRIAITNVLINAIEAFEKSGFISIKLAMDSHDWVGITIGDNGKGMSREVLEHVFEPFYSTKGTKGNGLGLSQVYGIITRANGTIETKSSLGVGTEVHIKLPAQQDYVVNAEYKESHNIKFIKGKEILIVEDEKAIQDIYKGILESSGYKLCLADSAESALEIYKKYNKFDMIICDLGLPKMNGWDFIEIIRKTNKEIPILVITGWGGAITGDKAFTYDVFKVVAKPVGMNELLNDVYEILSFSERK